MSSGDSNKLSGPHRFRPQNGTGRFGKSGQMSQSVAQLADGPQTNITVG